ncbi:hypothetical protein V494_07495 [Pseudogymnoascus sp. VKM F-4513 (FW-928)]|nr:hypothetical protein V494_07495 [Pseudogymnoascus sp. VKM F-4513 (FW-928)]
MKAVVVDKFVSNYDELKVTELEHHEVPYGHALVQVKAAGLTFVDLLYARGKHQNNKSLHTPPFTLGSEFSGVILSTNPPALPLSSFSPGARVYGSHLGAFATHIHVPLSSFRIIPSQWSFQDAAGISSTLPVSYGALKRAGLEKGQSVLVHAAAGGLGLMAVQVAKALGCTVIATASTAAKLAVAKKFGADYLVNYSDEKWEKRVLEATNGVGVDVVYDPVGLVDQSLRCLKHGGRILLIGFAGREGNMEKIAMNRVLLKQAVIIGYRYGETHRRNPEETRVIWETLDSMITKGDIKPTVYDGDFKGLESVPHAMQEMADRKVWGKAVINLDDVGQVANIPKKVNIRASI